MARNKKSAEGNTANASISTKKDHIEPSISVALTVAPKPGEAFSTAQLKIDDLFQRFEDGDDRAGAVLNKLNQALRLKMSLYDFQFKVMKKENL